MNEETKNSDNKMTIYAKYTAYILRAYKKLDNMIKIFYDNHIDITYIAQERRIWQQKKKKAKDLSV